jgi:excinuclease ABC subunit C
MAKSKDGDSDSGKGASDKGGRGASASGDKAGDKAGGGPMAESVQLAGVELIAREIKGLPASPGVYRMLGEKGEVLYVGKARELRKRVASYTRLAGHAPRIQRMIMSTRAMEFITTATESEALLLEANLIKRMKPRFNVLMRDDKAFPYILITHDHEAPQILKHRGARRRKGSYFGPFASVSAVNRAINYLQKAFLLRSCSDSVYANRSRPCLLYQIKRCAAPCTGEISLAQYGELARETERFLTGKSNHVRRELARRMEEAAAELEYERAAIYRDRLAALAHVQGAGGVNAASFAEADIFALHMEGGQSCVQVFFFRNNQNWGNNAFFPRIDKSHEAGEILESFIPQFYDGRAAPRLILLSHPLPAGELLAEALSGRAGRKVELAFPRRGEKRALVEHALDNARRALGRKMSESASQLRLLGALAELFSLDEAPRRIEIYDNSHISGSNAIGAMVVAGREGWIKSQYRKFNIRSQNISPGDDFAMMREVMRRRFSRLLREEEAAAGGDDGDGEAGVNGEEAGSGGAGNDCEEEPLRPDLLLIDGGAGQVAAVGEILAELGLEDIPHVGVAKGADRNAGRERFFIPGREPFTLDPHDPVMYFIQRLRDEAHRFAIGSHRARRKKAMRRNPLDDAPGVGPARKKALLAHFGSARAVGDASVRDLARVEGISRKLAQAIFDHFHDGDG